MKTKAYHTISDRGNPEQIKSEAPFIGKRENPWLSIGYYFWDDDIDQAHKWGRDGYQGKYVICSANIALQNVLDLHNRRSHQKYFIKLLEIAQKHFDKKQIYDVPLGKAIQFLRKLNERQKGIFDYDGVRCADFPYQGRFIFVENRKEYTLLNPRIQICVFKEGKRCIESVVVTHPKKYR